jgi:hypothetical protein
MPIQRVRRVEAVEVGVCVDVPAGKLSVSLLSSCRGSGLMGRTSHELEGHGHALLIVRHVCGISRGVFGWSGGGGEGGVAAGWSTCLSMRPDASRLSTKEEAGASPEAAAHVPGQASLATCNSNRAGQARAIPLISQTSSTPLHSIHNAVHSCLQHAQAACHARLPRPAAREESAPPVNSQDEVACPCMYNNTRLTVLYANAVTEGGALWLAAAASATSL